MNDKQQLAAMGEHVASMKLTIHGHGINSEEEASGGFLTRCPPCSSQQQQTPCMAKRIEELEAQVRVMAGLLREAKPYMDHRGGAGVKGYTKLTKDIDATLAGKLPAPVVPEDWKMVPVDPTPEMLIAINWPNDPIGYAAMIAASPSPDTTK